MMEVIRGAIKGEIPVSDEPLPVWLEAQGAGTDVRAALHAITQAWMALNSEEVRANAFFEYLRAQAGRGHHGIPPEGSRRLAENLADYVRGQGGEIRVNARVASAIHAQPIDAAQVVVTAGTKQALFNACFSLFGAGDEVLVPTPDGPASARCLRSRAPTPVDRARSRRRVDSR